MDISFHCFLTNEVSGVWCGVAFCVIYIHIAAFYNLSKGLYAYWISAIVGNHITLLSDFGYKFKCFLPNCQIITEKRLLFMRALGSAFIPKVGMFCSQAGNILVPAWDCFIPLMGTMSHLNGNHASYFIVLL